MTSYIYFIQAQGDGPIKIGLTTANPYFRTKSLQTGCPWPVRLVGAIEGTASQEKQIHAVLCFFRTHGEWFQPHPIVLASVKTALEYGRLANHPPSRKNAKFDNHVSRVIGALGGTGEVAEKTNSLVSAVSNWRKANKFPPDTYILIKRELERIGNSAPDALWGMRVAEAAE